MTRLNRTLRATYVTGPTAADAPTKLFQAPIIRLQIVRESSTAAPYQVRSPQDAYAGLLRDRFADCDREVFVAVLLDTKNHVLAVDPCFVGSLDTAMVTMREAFKSAMLLGAAAVIFAHNHPSGACDPSPEDVLMTRQLVDAGRLLGITVLDHLILGAGTYISLRERGLGFSA